MGKTGKWIKNFLGGKKEKEKEKVIVYGGGNEQPTTPPVSVTPREKKRWSFRRSSATAPPGQRDLFSSSAPDSTATTPNAKQDSLESSDHDQKQHALAVAAATAAAADAAAAAAKAAAAVIQLTAAASGGGRVSEAAATKIQAVFRGYLARKALNALKGLVKLQALVRGHLVRKQAAATLRCMQALITAQARARAQRIKMAEDQEKPSNQRLSVHSRFRHSFKDYDRGMEDNIKIVEMDLGDSKGSTKSRNSYSNHGQTEHRFSSYNPSYSKQETPQISPSPSAVTDQSPRAYSGHFEDYSFNTAQSSPQCYSAMAAKPDPPRIPVPYARSEYSDSIYNDYPFYPSYMANTESSRAKVRSHSAPKQRPETFERQPSRRRPSIEGRNVPRAVRMQRSSSHVGSAAQNYQYPWSIKLDRSNISLKDSECGSTCSVLTTNTMYCRPVVGFDVQGNRY